jgi:hypothetical protein
MKLQKLSVDSFLQIKGIDLEMGDKPVHLIAGLNECGKSSLHEAIRFAYLGETERVSLKRDYKLMVRDGSQTGTVRIEYQDANEAHEFIQRDVGTGKVTDGYDGDPEFAVAHVMDATKVPLLNATQQRDFLLEFLGVHVSNDDISTRMQRKGVSEEMIEQVAPLLRAGFGPAHTEAKSKQSTARATWEGMTGERWGSQKGGTWKPESKVVVKPALDAKEREVEKYRAAYESAAASVGREYGGGVSGPCPTCGEPLLFDGKGFILKEDTAQDLDEAKASRAAANKRDMHATLLRDAEGELATMKAEKDHNENLISLEADAKLAHELVLKWMQVAELLAPNGIPGEILADALGPMNDRLRHTASVTGWDQVSITPEMEIMIASRPYALGSESAQWRAQAAIAEAISYVGEIGLVCLDRIDVLDLPNRSRLLKWINSIADDHSTILLFGTLKEPPKRLPPTFQLHWLDHGAFVDEEQAA